MFRSGCGAVALVRVIPKERLCSAEDVLGGSVPHCVFASRLSSASQNVSCTTR